MCRDFILAPSPLDLIPSLRSPAWVARSFPPAGWSGWGCREADGTGNPIAVQVHSAGACKDLQGPAGACRDFAGTSGVREPNESRRSDRHVSSSTSRGLRCNRRSIQAGWNEAQRHRQPEWGEKHVQSGEERFPRRRPQGPEALTGPSAGAASPGSPAASPAGAASPGARRTRRPHAFCVLGRGIVPQREERRLLLQAFFAVEHLPRPSTEKLLLPHRRQERTKPALEAASRGPVARELGSRQMGICEFSLCPGSLLECRLYVGNMPAFDRPDTTATR